MSRARAVGAVVVIAAATLAGGCISDFRWPGTLPGEAQGAVELATGAVSTETVHADGTPDQRAGTLTTARYTLGVAIGMSRFGTLSGFEASVGAGWLTGAAAARDGDHPAQHFYVDSEFGGIIQPLALHLGSASARALVDFGVGTSIDDDYRYAGARVGVGAHSRRWALDLAVRRRFGATPGNDGAHEDHAGVTVSFRRARMTRTVHLGLAYVRGDQRSFDGAGAEVAVDDDLLRGRYRVIALVLGYGTADPPERVDFRMR